MKSVLLFMLLLSVMASKSVRYSSKRNEELRKLSIESHNRWGMTGSIGENPDCWTNAYNGVIGSCEDMTREERLSFTWSVLCCYYEDLGRPVPLCHTSDIRSCTPSLSSTDFDVFTQLYNHGDSICFFRESKEWQERTDRSIQHLEEATEETIVLLEQSLTKESELLRLQDINLALHEESYTQGQHVLQTVTETDERLTEINSHLMQSFTALRNETEGYFNSVHTVMKWINEKIETISGLQSLFHSSFEDIQMLLLFTLKVVMIYFMTSLPGMCVLRPYLYIYIVLALLIERMMIYTPIRHLPMSIKEGKDLMKENYCLLQSMMKQMQKMQQANQSPNSRCSLTEEMKEREITPQTCRSCYPFRSVYQNYDELNDRKIDDDYACRTLFMSDDDDDDDDDDSEYEL